MSDLVPSPHLEDPPIPGGPNHNATPTPSSASIDTWIRFYLALHFDPFSGSAAGSKYSSKYCSISKQLKRLNPRYIDAADTVKYSSILTILLIPLLIQIHQ
ncbi:hypothetical protein DFP73DRAFT_596285 [Morchella snyderi]|nr:hypothetical protein DFP73DRAFT_596285 [Morchella snyderi]